MLFNSAEFLLIFLPFVLLGFYLIGRIFGLRASLFWLFTSSLFFYGWWNPKYLALILLSIIVNFLIGQRLMQKASRPLLTCGVVFNLGLLFFFKYAMFFTQTYNALTSSSHSVGAILLPLAISFFTFQQIAYLVDSHRAEAGDSDFLSYCLFVTFFPQLIAGPIVHHKEMMPQFQHEGVLKPRLNNFVVGLTILSIGLFKKVMIADQLDLYASPVFDQALTGEPMLVTTAWIGVLAYTFQIYFDFSGYTDMATGAARMFGIRLPLNFFSPYKSESIIEFWRRWHITLSRFLKDYLYISLGGNRKGSARRYANLFLTMLIGGLWHGAAWNFIIWGGLHGFYLTINHGWRNLTNIRLPRWVSQGVTFIAVVIAWVFFRAEGFDTAIHMIKSMFWIDTGVFFQQNQWAPLGELVGVQRAKFAVPFLGFCLFWVWYLPNTSEIMRLYRPFIANSVISKVSQKQRWMIWQPNFVWGVLFGLLLTISLWTAIYDPNKVFLYFQF